MMRFPYLSGPEARGETPPATYPSVNLSPYKHSNGYDAWGNLTSQFKRIWRFGVSGGGGTFTNNRKAGVTYDAAGNELYNVSINSFFDALGRKTRIENWPPPVGGGQTGNPSGPSVEILQNLDGDGQPAKRAETRKTETFVNGGPQTTITPSVTTTYYVRSTLAGGDIVNEVNAQGEKCKAYIYALGERFAEQNKIFSGSYYLQWRVNNPIAGTLLEVFADGAYGRTELDPNGAEVGNYDPWVDDPTPTYLEMRGQDPLYIQGGDPFDYSGGHTRDGLPISNSEANRLAGSDAVARAPQQDYISIVRNGVQQLARFQAFGDGYQGYVPVGAKYLGNGVIGGSSRGGGFGARSYRSDTNIAAINGGTGEAELGYAGQGGGQLGGGVQQTGGIVGQGGGQTGGISEQGSPDLSEAEKQRRRCMGARELVRREAKLGNTLASLQSSITFGTSKLSYMDNHLVGNFMINGREVDVDWLIDINASRLFAPGAPLPNLPVDHGALGRYLGGKSIWVTLQKLAGQTPTNSHLQDQGERNAIMLATLRIT
jgi:hypothetical protein